MKLNFFLFFRFYIFTFFTFYIYRGLCIYIYFCTNPCIKSPYTYIKPLFPSPIEDGEEFFSWSNYLLPELDAIEIGLMEGSLLDWLLEPEPIKKSFWIGYVWYVLTKFNLPVGLISTLAYLSTYLPTYLLNLLFIYLPNYDRLELTCKGISKIYHLTDLFPLLLR